MCAMKEPGADRPKDLEQDEAEEMCTGPMKEEELEESSMGGSSVAGAAGLRGGPWSEEKEEVEDFNKKEKKQSELKGTPIEEMYSTGGHYRGGRPQYVDEFKGYVERSKHQGLKNVTPPKRRLKIKFKR